MKIKLHSIATLVLGATLMGVQAQEKGGLSSVGADMGSLEEFETPGLPFTTTIFLNGGWDSNTTTSPINSNDSLYLNGGIGAVYGLGNKTTRVNLGGHFGAVYYFDQPPGIDKDFYNVRFSLGVTHRASPRLTLSNNGYFTYEIEPDFEVGASTARRNDQYTYFYNRFAAAYAWSRRFSTVTDYTISGIYYEKNLVSTTEDRFTHHIGNQFRYMLTRQTSLTASYRWQHTSYDNFDRTVQSHFALVGVDHFFSRQTSGNVSVGTQFYDDSVSGTDTKPYAEWAVNHTLTEDTNLRWANRLGFETNELAGFDTRYTFRTGLSASHRLSPYIVGNLGVSYIHSEFDGNPDVGTGDLDENAISLSTGLSFRVLRNADLNARYFYTHYGSDNPLREYDRHRVSLGLSSTF